ncbi:MAG: aspartate kinase [Deltaproteobacteria bacterium CG_4_8_14_3_um_filter_45_9]|nr:MAG: aspartate kinase [Deltaproteobacteria bacterium CG03_land_8_20_14_0_80_45_14]PIX23693.1 MAG: aspartate kinase [Deltaproteobacteria bacterium CG_4_8_14_3_um_filter_45_9]
MALVVQKYGGTSVGDVERIRNVARRILNTKNQGHEVVVVVSAMAGETDKLIRLAQQVIPSPDEREMDVLISTGEQVSIALLAIALKAMGADAKSYLGFQIKIATDSAFGKARIAGIESEKVLNDLKNGRIVVVAGFQGVDESDNITTLGRGGSDTTAVAIAAALKADVCEIYTDVEGVYTTDPNICPKARKLSKISYDEMLEMASLGAKVLQIRSVEFAKKYDVPIHVRSSFNDNPGTIVCKEDKEMERVVVSGVTYNKNEAKIEVMRVPDVPGMAAKIFKPIADANIVVDMIIQTSSTEKGCADVAFTVPKSDFTKTLQIVKEIIKGFGGKEVKFNEDIAKVSIVGVGMRSHSNVATQMFSALAEEGINIQMISTSEIKISCIIDSKYTELAVRALHDAFGLDKPPMTEEK